MSRDASAFQQSLKRQEFTPFSAADKQAHNGESSKKRKKSSTSLALANIVYSQPADTGSGADVNTQIVYAVDHLKKKGTPTRLEDLAIMTNTQLTTNQALFDRFRAHDKVVYDPNTNLYSYKHDFTARTKATLLTDIQRHTKRGGGIAVRTLRDSWKDAPAAIEELEKEGEVLVTRTQKDQTMRMVFWNEIKPVEGSGGIPVEKEFQELWHSLKVPPEADLLRSLASEGLQATAAEKLVPKAGVSKKKGKKAAPRYRPVRLTNVHLKGDIDLSKDYAPSSSK